MKTSFTGEDFAEALATGSLIEPIILFGIVKSADDPLTILFSVTICDPKWITIPIDMIENIEWLRKVKCGEQSYDFIRLLLKDIPDSKTKALAALLRNYINLARPRQVPSQVAMPPHPITPPRYGYLGRCTIFCGNDVLWDGYTQGEDICAIGAQQYTREYGDCVYYEFSVQV